MKTRIFTAFSVLLALVIVSCAMISDPSSSLKASDLVTEYERLIPINQALNQGRWVIDPADYSKQHPKVLGTYQSRQVGEIFICGDVCPQYGSIIITYPNVLESDCPSISGDAIYSYFWGTQYEGCSPLTVRDGTLAQNGSSWSIVGDGIGNPPSHYDIPLVFNDASSCWKGGAKVACQGFQTGQPTVVIGLKSANAILVLRLDL